MNEALLPISIPEPTRAKKFTAKGDVVGIFEPLLIIPDENSTSSKLLASASVDHCVTTFGCQRCGKSFERLPDALIKLDMDEDEQEVPFVEPLDCLRCGMSGQYCSVDCQNNERVDAHTLFCLACMNKKNKGKISYTVNAESDDDSSDGIMWQSLLRYICRIRSNESFTESALHQVVCILFYSSSKRKPSSRIICHILNQIIATAAQDSSFVDKCGKSDNDEAWALLHAAMFNTDTSNTHVKQSQKDPKFPTPQFTNDNYSTVFSVLSRTSIFSLFMQSKLQTYASTRLRLLDGDMLSKALEVYEMLGVCKYVFKDDGQKIYHINTSDIALESDLLPSDRFEHRKATRISQAADEPANDEESLFYRIRHNYLVLSLHLSTIHSCIPNCVVIGDKSNDNRLLLKVIALCDIAQDEILTEAKVDITGSISERDRSLKSIYGKRFCCSCIRCKIEAPELDSNDVCPKYRAVLGDLAMQQGRYMDAIRIYDNAFKSDSMNANLMHARCAARLAYGSIREAHQLWKKAVSLFPNHDGILLQSKKDSAYSHRACLNDAFKVNISHIKEIIPNMCYLTTSVLTAEECELAIKLGEDAAKLGGWTTSRHYAVPTTDLPIHEVPLLLQWFNDILSSRLRSLLALHFGEDKVGLNGSRIVVHDAFIVRYNAEEQKHLPLHRDESTYSFTIALNEYSDYDGGGTYIADLGVSVRPKRGSVLSFRGDKLLHGGDPVTKGIRYVIVCFCYAVDESKENMKVCWKRRKMETRTEQVQNNSTQSVFSFGFHL